MKSIQGVGLNEVKAVYSGPQADFMRLVFGEQLHIGGMKASVDLAERAGIGGAMKGIDLCCCNGAGMRMLVRFRNVASMIGVDATDTIVQTALARCREEGLDDRIRVILADACASGLPAESADFVWGEDAWCYVTDKPKLIAEAARLVRRGGVIAFTDWVEGPAGLSDAEAQQVLSMMSFANLEDLNGYRRLLSASGCEVELAEDTGRFASHMKLFVDMIEMQLTYDVLRTLAFREDLLKTLSDGFRFLLSLSRAGKIIQARFIASRS